MHHESIEQWNWWKLVLTGALAIAFGIAAVALPAGILSARILDAIFGVAKPFSASMTAVAALLALVALVAIDGALNLFAAATDKRASRIRGVIGIAVTILAVSWPGRTMHTSSVRASQHRSRTSTRLFPRSCKVFPVEGPPPMSKQGMA